MKSRENAARAAAERFRRLKEEMAGLGLVRPGSLVERYMPCGQPGCRCMQERPVLHGPYSQWSHMVRGKTVTPGCRQRRPRRARSGSATTAG